MRRVVFYQVYTDGTDRWSGSPTEDERAFAARVRAERGPNWRGVLTFTEDC